MHPLERIWKRAQIHEETVKLFRQEAARKPDFERAAQEVVRRNQEGLGEKEREDLGHQMDNFVHAAQIVSTLKKAYADRPQDLYFALYGKRQDVKIVPTTFTIAFELPGHVYRKIAPAGSAGLSAHGHVYQEQFHENVREELRQARIAVHDLLKEPISIGYVDGLATIQDRTAKWFGMRRPMAEHEERHVISKLLDAHEEYGGGIYSSMDRRAHARGPTRPYADTPKYEEAWADWGKSPAWYIGLNLPASYGIPDLKEARAWLQAPAQAARLLHIRWLQWRHGLSDEFTAHLLRTNDLSQTIDAIRHNATRLAKTDR